MSRDPLTHAPGYAGSPQGYAGANPVMNTDPSGLMVPLEEEWVGDHYDQSDGRNYAGCGGCQDGELETDPSPDPQLAPPQAVEDPVDDIREMPHGGTSSSDDVASSADKPHATRSAIADYIDEVSLTLWATAPVTGLATAGVGCSAGFSCPGAIALGVTLARYQMTAAGVIGFGGAIAHCAATEWAECGVGVAVSIGSFTTGGSVNSVAVDWALDGVWSAGAAAAGWLLH